MPDRARPVGKRPRIRAGQPGRFLEKVFEVKSGTKASSGRGRIVPVNGDVLKIFPKAEALLTLLYADLGRIVPYAKICDRLGYPSVHRRHLHTLRQYVSQINKTLAGRRARYVIAVAISIGYALCEIPDNERRGINDRQSTGRPKGTRRRLGRAVAKDISRSVR